MEERNFVEKVYLDNKRCFWIFRSLQNESSQTLFAIGKLASKRTFPSITLFPNQSFPFLAFKTYDSHTDKKFANFGESLGIKSNIIYQGFYLRLRWFIRPSLLKSTSKLWEKRSLETRKSAKYFKCLESQGR